MIKTNFAFYASKVLADIAKDLIYFPVWWYTKGAWKMLAWIKNFLHNMLKSLALLVWVKNLFVPMYGQRDIAGFFISFFMRLFQIIFRSLAFLFFVILSLIAIIIWLSLPIVLIYQIVLQFNG
ncbi:MAG: hypothetical protein ABIG10_04155 [bacterium]